MWGPFLLFLFFPMRGWSQSPKQPPVDRTKRAPGKARYKRLREQAFVLVGAGDIASCKDPEGAQATAKLIEQIPGTVFAAGDLAYEKGSAIGVRRPGRRVRATTATIWALGTSWC